MVLISESDRFRFGICVPGAYEFGLRKNEDKFSSFQEPPLDLRASE